jgi:hypothetical protein
MSKHRTDIPALDPAIVEECRILKRRLEQAPSKTPMLILVGAAILALVLIAAWIGRGAQPLDDERMLVVPPEGSVQILNPICIKTPSGANQIVAEFRNNSSDPIIRLDVALVSTQGESDHHTLTQTDHTFIFSPGLRQDQVRRLEFEIENASVDRSLSSADLECWIRPLRIYSYDADGRERIATMNGSPTRVARQWESPTRVAGPSF